MLFWDYIVILRSFNQTDNKVQTIYQFQYFGVKTSMELTEHFFLLGNECKLISHERLDMKNLLRK